MSNMLSSATDNALMWNGQGNEDGRAMIVKLKVILGDLGASSVSLVHTDAPMSQLFPWSPAGLLIIDATRELSGPET